MSVSVTLSVCQCVTPMLPLPASNHIVIVRGCKDESTIMQSDLIGCDHVGRPVGFHVVVFDDAPRGPALDRMRSDTTFHSFTDFESKGRPRRPGSFLA